MAELEERVRELDVYSRYSRLKIMEMFAKSRKGGLAGSMSMVELYTALYLDYEGRFKNEERPLVIPKGTSALAFYATMNLAGAIEDKLLREYGTPQMPHIMHRHSLGADATSYALGEHVGYAVGLALSQRLQNKQRQVVCFIGDGEMQEGLDQAAKYASKVNLENLTVIIDCNRIQSCFDVEVADPTMEYDASEGMKKLRNFWSSLGWNAVEIDGHDLKEILNAYEQIGRTGRPLAIIGNTVKGKGILSMEKGPSKYTHKMTDDEVQLALTDFQTAVQNLGLPNARRLVNLVTDDPIQLTLPKEFDYSRAAVMQDTFVKWLQRFIELNKGKAYTVNTDHPWVVGLGAAGKVYLPSEQESPHIFPGLNERLSLQVTKGLADGGLVPILAGPSGHLYAVREDWRYINTDKSRVLIVGNKPGTTLQHWGPTHTSYDDIEFMRGEFAHIFQPATHEEVIMILNQIYSHPDKFLPAYLRLPERSAEVFPNDANVNEIWQNGFYAVNLVGVGSSDRMDYVSLITSGDILASIMEMKENLSHQEGLLRVINLFNLTSFDRDKLRHELRGSRKIISLTEATPESMLDVLFYALSPEQRAIYTPLGIKKGVYGTKEDVYKFNGIDKVSLIEVLA